MIAIPPATAEQFEQFLTQERCRPLFTKPLGRIKGKS